MTINRRPIWKTPWIVPLLVLAGALVYGGIAAFQAAWVEGCKMASANGLQQIMMAMRNYHQANGCYPPQYLADKEGRPAHSWRVLILPYLELDDLSRRYRFDEPWDGPHNRLLAKEAPRCFRSPNADPKSTSTITDYVAIIGKDTLWRGAIPLRQEDVELIEQRRWKEESEGGYRENEGTRIIWFVEVANSGINWMEPRDIPLQQALVGINVSGGIQSDYSDVLPVQFIPYGCRLVPADISPDAFRKLLTVSGATEENASGKKSPVPKGAAGGARTDSSK